MSKDHADLQKATKEYLESLGCIVIVTKHGKTSKYYRRPESEKGMLDLMVLVPKEIKGLELIPFAVDRFYYSLKWFEIKTARDIIKPDQQDFILKEMEKGHECFVIESIEEVKRVMK